MTAPPNELFSKALPSLFLNSISMLFSFALLRKWRDVLQVLAYSLAHFFFQVLTDFFAHGPHHTLCGFFFIFWLFVIAASSVRQGILFLFVIGVCRFGHSHVRAITRRVCACQQFTHGRRAVRVKPVGRR